LIDATAAGRNVRRSHFQQERMSGPYKRLKPTGPHHPPKSQHGYLNGIQIKSQATYEPSQAQG